MSRPVIAEANNRSARRKLSLKRENTQFVPMPFCTRGSVKYMSTTSKYRAPQNTDRLPLCRYIH